MASDRKALVDLLDRCADAFHEAVYGKQTDECQGSDLCALCTPCESALLVLRAEVMAVRAALSAPPDAQGGAPVADPGTEAACQACAIEASTDWMSWREGHTCDGTGRTK